MSFGQWGAVSLGQWARGDGDEEWEDMEVLGQKTVLSRSEDRWKVGRRVPTTTDESPPSKTLTDTDQPPPPEAPHDTGKTTDTQGNASAARHKMSTPTLSTQTLTLGNSPFVPDKDVSPWLTRGDSFRSKPAPSRPSTAGRRPQSRASSLHSSTLEQQEVSRPSTAPSPGASRRLLTPRSRRGTSPILSPKSPDMSYSVAYEAENRIYSDEMVQSKHIMNALNIPKPVPPLLFVPQLGAWNAHAASPIKERRPLSARGVDLGYAKRAMLQDHMLFKATKRANSALNLLQNAPDDSVVDQNIKTIQDMLKEDEEAYGNGNVRFMTTATDKQKFTPDRTVFISKTVAEVPKQLIDLSLTAKLTRRNFFAEENEASKVVITSRRPGYNPLLRKYEQKMPKEVAMRLAQNAKDPAAVLAPNDPVQFQQAGAPVSSSAQRNGGAAPHAPPGRPPTTPRRFQPQRSKTTGLQDTHSDDGGDASDEKQGKKTKIVLTPRMMELATPRTRNPDMYGSGASKVAFEWKLPLAYRNKDDAPGAKIDWIARNMAELREPAAEETDPKVARLRYEEKLVEHSHKRQEAYTQRRRHLLEGLARDRAVTKEERDKEEFAWRQRVAVQKGFASLFFASKFVHAACYILRDTRPDQIRKMAGKTVLVSPFLRKLETNQRAKREMNAKLGDRHRRETFRHVLNAIRWVFDHRRATWKAISARSESVLSKWLVRLHVRRQRQHYERAVHLIREAFTQASHAYMVRNMVHKYIRTVVRCQRVFKFKLIKSQAKTAWLQHHFDEMEAARTLRELVREVRDYTRELQLEAQGKVGERFKQDHVAMLKDISKTKTPEQRALYKKMCPALSVWITMGLERLAAELHRVASLDPHYVEICGTHWHSPFQHAHSPMLPGHAAPGTSGLRQKPPDFFGLALNLFERARMPPEYRKAVVLELRTDLERQYLMEVRKWFSNREARRTQEKEKMEIRSVLVEWSTKSVDLPRLFDKDHNHAPKEQAQANKHPPVFPRWPMEYLNEHSVAEWIAYGTQMRMADYQKQDLSMIPLKALVRNCMDRILTPTETSVRGGASGRPEVHNSITTRRA